MMAAIRGAVRASGVGALLARLRPRLDLLEQAADRHADQRWAIDRQSGGMPLQYPVEAIELGRRGAARHADDGGAVDVTDHQQIAGVDRHPEVGDVAAAGGNRRRNDVIAVDDRRGAEHQHRVGAGADRCADGGGNLIRTVIDSRG